jgi:hypothetical protein
MWTRRPSVVGLLATLGFAVACGSSATTVGNDAGGDATRDRRDAAEAGSTHRDASADSGLSCAPFQAVCGAAPSTFCASVQVDPRNCGGCGLECAHGAYCSQGVCGATCTGLTSVACSGTCVDTESDNKNCGSCGHACPKGQVCSAATCAATCASNYSLCGSGVAAYCAETAIDPDNCGACDMVCPVGGSCSNGQCATGLGDGGTGPLVVSGALVTSAPSGPSSGIHLVSGGFEFGPLKCNAQGLCVTGGIVP